jgi:lysophospholipase L1-like esterase
MSQGNAEIAPRLVSSFPQAKSRRGAKWVGRLLLVGGGCLALSLAHQWLSVGTHRFYLENRPEGSTPATETARQRFEVRGGRVEPEIMAAESQTLAFPIALGTAGRFHVRALSSGPATIEVAVVEQGVRRTLCRRALSGTADIAEAVPVAAEAIALVNQGVVRWVDPRIVDEPRATPQVLLLVALGLGWCWLRRSRYPPSPPELARSRRFLLGGLTAALSLALGLASLEGGLRAMGSRLPPWIAVERRNLGEVRADPRWQDSASYGPRLAPHVRAVCQWQHGDVVRMGFLAPDLVRHPAYTFPLATDGEGFRNASEEAAAGGVAALGDSFTDALTLPAELTWPSRLANLLHANVRNYGTAGFGPGQELRVLREYALPRRPRLVVVAFFAGNDLMDAERFESFEHSGAFPPSGLGWKFKEVIARFDQLYVMSLYQGARHLARDHVAERSVASGDPGPGEYSGEDLAAPPAPAPSFDRGLFTVPVAGQSLRFAFLPPYLNCLKLSREDLVASRGWAATRRSYREMHRLCRERGTRLAVMFIPSKSQVYLPLVASAFPRPALEQAIALSLRDLDRPPGLDVVMRNRLALNGLMREFCDEEGIPFLDLTETLQGRLARGQNVYFPDDSHWNAAGHETAAAALAGWLHL